MVMSKSPPSDYKPQLKNRNGTLSSSLLLTAAWATIYLEHSLLTVFERNSLKEYRRHLGETRQLNKRIQELEININHRITALESSQQNICFTQQQYRFPQYIHSPVHPGTITGQQVFTNLMDSSINHITSTTTNL